MMKISGIKYKTIADAAEFFRVSGKTIGQWIYKGIIPKPETMEYGTRVIRIFRDDFLQAAKRSLDAYKERKNSTKAQNPSQKALWDREN